MQELENSAVGELKRIEKTKQSFKKLYVQSQTWKKDDQRRQIEDVQDIVRLDRLNYEEMQNMKRERVSSELQEIDEKLAIWIKDAQTATAVVDEIVLGEKKKQNRLKYEERKLTEQLEKLATEARLIQQEAQRAKESPMVTDIINIESQIDKMRVKVNTAENIGKNYVKMRQQMEDDAKQYTVRIDKLETLLKDKKEHVHDLKHMLEKSVQISQRARKDMNRFITDTGKESKMREDELKQLRIEHQRELEHEKQSVNMLQQAAVDASQDLMRRKELLKRKQGIEEELERHEKHWQTYKKAFECSHPTACPGAFEALLLRVRYLNSVYDSKKEELLGSQRKLKETKAELNVAVFGSENEAGQTEQEIQSTKDAIEQSTERESSTDRVIENDILISEIGAALRETLERVNKMENGGEAVKSIRKPALDKSDLSKMNSAQLEWISSLAEAYGDKMSNMQKEMKELIQNRLEHDRSPLELTEDPDFKEWVENQFKAVKQKTINVGRSQGDGVAAEDEFSGKMDGGRQRRGSSIYEDSEELLMKGIPSRSDIKKESFNVTYSALKKAQKTKGASYSPPSDLRHALDTTLLPNGLIRGNAGISQSVMTEMQKEMNNILKKKRPGRLF